MYAVYLPDGKNYRNQTAEQAAELLKGEGLDGMFSVLTIEALSLLTLGTHRGTIKIVRQQ